MNWFFLIKVLGCYTTVHVIDMEVYFKVDCLTSEWIYLNSQPWRICLKSTLRIWIVILKIKWFKWFEFNQSDFKMTVWHNSHSLELDHLIFPVSSQYFKLEKFSHDCDNFHKIWIVIFKFRIFECSDFEQCSILPWQFFSVSILNFKWFEFWELRFINRSANHAPLNALPNS